MQERSGRREDAVIKVAELEIFYGGRKAVGPVSFDVMKSCQLTLLGPSGCGKSTTLRGIAGLETPHSGAIQIDGSEVFSGRRHINVPAERRGLSMVFQSYAIWPHMTVFDNVAFGLRVRRKSRAEIEAAVNRALSLVHMEAFSLRPASNLSGGQQQRVALARACAFSPSVLLFDEPLSNLDAKLRAEMRVELRELQRDLDITSIYVTHDLEEALAMSDSIVVMNNGLVEQIGTPAEIYNFPRTPFVADFVGSANLIAGKVIPELSREQDEVAIRTEDGAVVHGITHGREVKKEAVFAVRTVHFELTTDASQANTWQVEVKRVVFLGDLNEIHVTWGGRTVIVRGSRQPSVCVGQKVLLHVDRQCCVLLEAV